MRDLEVLAAAFGGLAGIIGCVPYVLLGRVAAPDGTQAGSNALVFLLLVPAISFILILVAMIICWLLAPQYLMVFAVACIIAFLLSTGTYVLLRSKKKKS